MRSAWRTVENRWEMRIVVHSPGRGQDPVEDLGLAPHVELGGRLVEQHHAGAEPDRAEGAGEGHPLPLAAGEVGATLVAAGQDGRQVAQTAGPGVVQRGRGTSSGAPVGATLSRRDSS